MRACERRAVPDKRITAPEGGGALLVLAPSPDPSAACSKAPESSGTASCGQKRTTHRRCDGASRSRKSGTCCPCLPLCRHHAAKWRAGIPIATHSFLGHLESAIVSRMNENLRIGGFCRYTVQIVLYPSCRRCEFGDEIVRDHIVHGPGLKQAPGVV